MQGVTVKGCAAAGCNRHECSRRVRCSRCLVSTLHQHQKLIGAGLPSVVMAWCEARRGLLFAAGRLRQGVQLLCWLADTQPSSTQNKTEKAHTSKRGQAMHGVAYLEGIEAVADSGWLCLERRPPVQRPQQSAGRKATRGPMVLCNSGRSAGALCLEPNEARS